MRKGGNGGMESWGTREREERELRYGIMGYDIKVCNHWGV